MAAPTPPTGPTTIPCNEGTWTLVGENQIFGYIIKRNTMPEKYICTYRMTGEAEPTYTDEGSQLFLENNRELRISLEAIDIYVMALGADGEVEYEWTV